MKLCVARMFVENYGGVVTKRFTTFYADLDVFNFLLEEM